MFKVVLSSFGITILPNSSTFLTMPVDFTISLLPNYTNSTRLPNNMLTDMPIKVNSFDYFYLFSNIYIKGKL